MEKPDLPADISCMARSRDEAIRRLSVEPQRDELVAHLIIAILGFVICKWMGWL